MLPTVVLERLRVCSSDWRKGGLMYLVVNLEGEGGRGEGEGERGGGEEGEGRREGKSG